jgi:hypothetical protein
MASGPWPSVPTESRRSRVAKMGPCGCGRSGNEGHDINAHDGLGGGDGLEQRPGGGVGRDGRTAGPQREMGSPS